jgi:hypothetical protein
MLRDTDDAATTPSVDEDETKFVDIVEAVRDWQNAVHDRTAHLFRISDLLIARCGRVGLTKANNGSEKILREISAELERQGLKHSVPWLRLLRIVGSNFPHDKRLLCEGVSWETRHKAGNWELLHAAYEVAQEEGEELTPNFIERYLKRLDDEAEQRRKREAGLGDSRPRDLVHALYDLPRDTKDARERFRFHFRTLKKYPGQLTEQEVSDIISPLEELVADLESDISWVTEHGAPQCGRPPSDPDRNA